MCEWCCFLILKKIVFERVHCGREHFHKYISVNTIYRPISRLCKWSRTGGQNNNKKWCLAPKGLNFLCLVLQLRYIFTDMKTVYRVSFWKRIASFLNNFPKKCSTPLPFNCHELWWWLKGTFLRSPVFKSTRYSEQSINLQPLGVYSLIWSI